MRKGGKSSSSSKRPCENNPLPLSPVTAAWTAAEASSSSSYSRQPKNLSTSVDLGGERTPWEPEGKVHALTSEARRLCDGDAGAVAISAFRSETQRETSSTELMAESWLEKVSSSSSSRS